MKAVNLIPVRRILARQRRRHVRRCTVTCATWAGVVLGLCVVGQGLGPGGVQGSDVLSDRMDKVVREIETQEQALTVARAELSSAQATLRATRAIANQPDWSVLLALLGKATGDDVMLRSIELQPSQPQATVTAGQRAAVAAPVRPGGPAAVAPRRAAGYVLSASGLAQSQLAVTQFVLRLERMGLFSRVTLVDTSREPFRDTEATSFRLECVIDGPASDDAGRSGK